VTREWTVPKRFSIRSDVAARDRETEMPAIVPEVLSSPGQSLDASARERLASHFGHNFSQVRVHTDQRAIESARALNADAYTFHEDIVFGSNQYAPETAGGLRLLAHELAHTVQQGPSRYLSVGHLEVSHPTDAAEREADTASEGVNEGRVATRAFGATARHDVIHRQLAQTGLGKAAQSAAIQQTYRELNGLEIGALLHKLSEMKQSGTFDRLFGNFDMAVGIHRTRLFMAMKAVELQGKITRDSFAAVFAAQMERIKEVDQRARILDFLGRSAAPETTTTTPKTCETPKGPGQHPKTVSETLVRRWMGKQAKEGDPGEGCVETPYVAGVHEHVCTIGYGSQIPDCPIVSKSTGQPLTKEQRKAAKVADLKCACEGRRIDCASGAAEKQLRGKAAAATTHVHEVVPVDLSQAQFDALVDITLHRGHLPAELLEPIKKYWCTPEGRDHVRNIYLKTAVTPARFKEAFEKRRQFRVWPPSSEEK
jgi:GH24 family phage-related lysozyme (muramidase)